MPRTANILMPLNIADLWVYTWPMYEQSQFTRICLFKRKPHQLLAMNLPMVIARCDKRQHPVLSDSRKLQTWRMGVIINASYYKMIKMILCKRKVYRIEGSGRRKVRDKLLSIRKTDELRHSTSVWKKNHQLSMLLRGESIPGPIKATSQSSAKATGLPEVKGWFWMWCVCYGKVSN